MGERDETDSVYHHDDQGNPVEQSVHDTDVLSESRVGDYWCANLRLLGWLLAIWFIVSFGGGILFADFLDQFEFFGFPLGFWFAHQGGIYVFVVLIFVYVWRMKKIDQAFGVDDEDHANNQAGGSTQ